MTELKTIAVLPHHSFTSWLGSDKKPDVDTRRKGKGKHKLCSSSITWKFVGMGIKKVRVDMCS